MEDHCFIERAEDYSLKGFTDRAAKIYGLAAKASQKKFKQTGSQKHGMETYLFRKHAARILTEKSPLSAAIFYGSAAKAARRLFMKSKDNLEKLTHLMNCSGDAETATELFGESADNVYYSLGLTAYAMFEAYKLTGDRTLLKEAEKFTKEMLRLNPARTHTENRWQKSLETLVKNIPKRVFKATERY